MSPAPPPQPSRHVAVLTCMDTRIDPLGVFSLQLGEAHILRNAGARVTPDVLRSLALSSNLMAVREIWILQHTTCGLTGTSTEELRTVIGTDMDFGVIYDHRAALDADVQALATTPYLGRIERIDGHLYNMTDGSVEQLVAWAR